MNLLQIATGITNCPSPPPPLLPGHDTLGFLLGKQNIQTKEVEVMFPSTCLTILLSRCKDTNCTRRYLVKQPVQVLQRVEKNENKSCFKLWPFFRLSPQSTCFFNVFDSPQLSGSFNVQDGGIALIPKNIHGSRGKIHLLCGERSTFTPRLPHGFSIKSTLSWLHSL